MDDSSCRGQGRTPLLVPLRSSASRRVPLWRRRYVQPASSTVTKSYQSDNEYKLDLENNKYKLDSGTVEIRPYSSITSMKIIQYALGGGDV